MKHMTPPVTVVVGPLTGDRYAVPSTDRIIRRYYGGTR